MRMVYSSCKEGAPVQASALLTLCAGLKRNIVCNTFRGSSAVEQSPVKRLVTGSIPVPGAKKLDTNSDFKDGRVRSPGPANGGAGLRFATAPPSLWREMKRILMLSRESIFSFLKTNNTKL